MAVVFMSYSHADEAMRDRLEKHLAMLKREGLIETWHDRRIVPGQPLDPTIMAQIEAADVFLFLLSVDFIDSHYCYDVEMGRALERQVNGEADVVPVILHSCEWLRTPLGRFTGVPDDGKPIAKAPYPEDAYVEVAKAVRRAIAARQLRAGSPKTTVMPKPAAMLPSLADGTRTHPRSSNLAIRKTITDADRHAFLEDGFDFVARFFEESLRELERRNPGVEGKLRRNGADVFTARAYRGGKQEAECRIRLGGMTANDSISFSYNANASAGSGNEFLSVKQDDQGLTFDALGMTTMMSNAAGKGLSFQGAAEFLWDLFIRSMQDRHQ